MNKIFTWKRQKSLIGLYGAGGFGREIMPLNGNFTCRDADGEEVKSPDSCFIENISESSIVNSIEILSESQFLGISNSNKYFNVGIGNSVSRERIAKHMISNEIKPITLISTRSNLHETSKLGRGGIVCAYASITSNAVIGEFFQANIYSYVAHDCTIGDYVTFAPGASCNGNVIIGDHAYIGTNASIKQGTNDMPINIGSHAVIGMGAVITKSVPDFAVVVGNPGKVIRYMNPIV